MSLENLKSMRGSSIDKLVKAAEAVSSTKPKKEVISEGSELRDRFKKLAGIL